MDNTIDELVEKLGGDCDADGKAQLREKLLTLDKSSSNRCSRASKSHKLNDGKSLGEVISKDLFCWSGDGSWGDTMNEVKREKIKYLSFEWGVETAKLKKDKDKISITITKNKWDSLAHSLRKAGIPHTWKSGKVGEIVINVRSEDIMDAIDMAKSMNALAESDEDPTYTDSISEVAGKKRNPHHRKLADKLDTTLVKNIDNSIKKFMDIEEVLFATIDSGGEYNPLSKDRIVFDGVDGPITHLNKLKQNAKKQMVRKSRSVLNIGEGSINKKQLAKELERVVMDGFYDAYEGFVKKHLQRGVDPIDLAEMFMFATSQTSTLQNQIRKLRSITEKELRDARSGKEVMDIELSMDDPFMKKIMKGVEKGLRKK